MSFLDSLDKRLTEAGKTVVNTTKNMTDSVKTSGELDAEKEKLEQYYAAIGENYIRNAGDELSSEYQEIYNQILAAQTRITELKQQLNASPGVKQCPSCHTAVSEESLFCPGCGAKLDEAPANGTGVQPELVNQPEPPQPQPNSGNTSNPAAQAIPQPVYGIYPQITEEQLPAKYKPISAWGYFGWTILFTIPLVGWIIALIKAFGNTENINLRNFARSMFCYFIITLILWLIVFGTTGCLASMM